ncbi:MAG: hypothetical protein V1662_02860, partial [Candidatus Omnitrophota bacterium]
ALEEYLKISYLYPHIPGCLIKAQLKSAQLFEEKQQWQEAKTMYEKLLQSNTASAVIAREKIQQLEKLLIKKD